MDEDRPKHPGGRPLGRKNNATLQREKIAQMGLKLAAKTKRTPLDVILAKMNGDGTITDAQFQAAVAAAPYIHPRLASTDTTVKSDNVHRVISDEPMTVEQWTATHATPANDAATTQQDDDDADGNAA